MNLHAFLLVWLCGLAALSPLPVAAGESMAASVALNVRASPGLDSPVLDTLFPGERVLLGTCRNDWCQIAHPGPDGWVYAPYLVAAGVSKSWSATSGDLPATLAADPAGDFDPGVTIELTPAPSCPPGHRAC